MYVVYHPTLNKGRPRVAPEGFKRSPLKSISPSYSYMIVPGTIGVDDD